MTNLSTNITTISTKVTLETKGILKPELKHPVITVNTVLPSKSEVLTLQELKTSKVKPINIIENSSKTLTAQAVSNTKKILSSGAMGVPIDAVFNSFDYEKGKYNSKVYVAKTLNGFASWSVFEAGSIAAVSVASKIAGKKMGVLGTMVIGTGIGIVSSSLYGKTIGKKVEEKIEKYIPEKISKPIADTMANYIAKPINKYIVNPIKNNPKTSIAIGLTVATALTLKYPKAFGVNIITGTIASTVIGVSGSFLLDKALSEKKSPTKIEESKVVTKEEFSWALEIEKKFKENSNSVSDEDAVRYYDILQKFESNKKQFIV